jgi:hypothetical protein
MNLFNENLITWSSHQASGRAHELHEVPVVWNEMIIRLLKAYSERQLNTEATQLLLFPMNSQLQCLSNAWRNPALLSSTLNTSIDLSNPITIGHLNQPPTRSNQLATQERSEVLVTMVELGHRKKQTFYSDSWLLKSIQHSRVNYPERRMECSEKYDIQQIEPAKNRLLRTDSAIQS